MGGFESLTAGDGAGGLLVLAIGPLLMFELGEPNCDDSLVLFISEGFMNFLSGSGDSDGFFTSIINTTKLCHSTLPAVDRLWLTLS